MIDERGTHYFLEEKDGTYQINVFNERWYRIKGKKDPYLNVTEWLQAAPKGYGYEDWLKKLGREADFARDEAKQLGSSVHGMVERVLKGEEITYNEAIPVREWVYFMAWCKFYKEFCDNYELVFNPEKDVETIVHYDNPEDPKFNFAGTVDLSAMLDNEKLVIFDWKTGKYVHDTAFLQVSAYAHAVGAEQAFIVHINPYEIKRNKYKVYELNSDDIHAHWQSFLNVQRVYADIKRIPKPKYKSYPVTVDLKIIGELDYK